MLLVKKRTGLFSSSFFFSTLVLYNHKPFFSQSLFCWLTLVVGFYESIRIKSLTLSTSILEIIVHCSISKKYYRKIAFGFRTFFLINFIINYLHIIHLHFHDLTWLNSIDWFLNKYQYLGLPNRLMYKQLLWFLFIYFPSKSFLDTYGLLMSEPNLLHCLSLLEGFFYFMFLEKLPNCCKDTIIIIITNHHPTSIANQKSPYLIWLFFFFFESIKPTIFICW